jgi:hypothetical protein
LQELLDVVNSRHTIGVSLSCQDSSLVCSLHRGGYFPNISI